MTDNTVLTLNGIGIPPYSARGLRQTLAPINEAGDVRRTINGKLVDLSLETFRKYTSRIQGDDQQPPANGGLWPGQLLTVGCISELAYKTIGGVAERAAVAGSERVEGDFTFYRPLLQMRVMSFDTDTDEWRAGVTWTLELEEV